MKKMLILCCIGIMFLLVNLFVSAQEIYLYESTIDYERFNKDEILVTLNTKSSKEWNEYSTLDFAEVDCISINELTEVYKNSSILKEKSNNNPNFKRILKLRINSKSVEETIQKINILKKRDEILSVNSNYYLNNKFELNKSANRVLGDDWGYDYINMSSALNLTATMSKTRISVGVIDTGVYTHSEFPSSTYSLSDSYRYVDGTETSSGNMNIMGNHGTAVAGIIGAKRDNNGIDGVCEDVRIYSFNIQHDAYDNQEVFSNMILALGSADLKNIKVVNISYGDTMNVPELKTAIENFNGLVICGAGNSNSNNDNLSQAIYPASYNSSNIISVGGIDRYGERYTIFHSDVNMYEGSNYGATSVDVFAPAKDIYSLDTTSSTSYNSNYSGTSFAAPFVTGLAAYIWSVCPNLTYTRVKEIIMSSVTINSNLIGLCVSGGVVNAEAAIRMATNHSHNCNIYEYYDNTYHRAVCECGYSILENHSWRVIKSAKDMLLAVGAKQCTKCGCISL